HLAEEPGFKPLPGGNLIVYRGCTRLDRLQMRLKHLMDEPFLALEVVIELPLAGVGGLDDGVRARRSDALFVKQIGCGSDDLSFCLGSFSRAGPHFLYL